MDPIIGGSLISGGLGLLGSIGGSLLSGRSNDKATEANISIQRELAQNGLSWRVADAKKAGINPLAALGASLPSGSPVAVGQDYGDLGLGRIGQDIGRAMQAKMTTEQRELHELNKKLLQTQIEGQSLENRSKANALNAPPLPSAEYTNPSGRKDPTVEIVPTQINASDQQGVESGVKPMYQKVIDNEGYLTYMPTEQLADVLESYTPAYIREMNKYLEDLAGSANAYLREKGKRRMAPYLKQIRPKSPSKGYEYRYNPNRMAWKLMKIGPSGSHIYEVPLKGQGESGIKFKFPGR